MRVLFAHSPEKTVFNYLVTLGWALRTAGHEVRFASQPSFADTITESGLTALPVGMDHDPWRLAKMHPDAVEEERAGVPAPYDVAFEPEKATWDYMLSNSKIAVDEWHKVENFPVIGALVRFARQWQPDLIIWDSLTLAGAIAAKACGAAHARLLWSVDVLALARDHYLRLKNEQPEDRRADPLAEWLGAYARKFGGEFSEDMITGHFTIDQFPRSLQTEGNVHYIRMQYVPYGGRAVVPKWLWAQPERPRVGLTLGTSATERYNGYTVGVQQILDSLADLDIEVVATIAEREQAKLDRVPGNCRLVSYVPLHALAPTCAAVINHAGAATLTTIARYGVPQLALPLHFDEPPLGMRMAELGAGLCVHSDDVTGPTVRENVLRLLNEPGFRAGAARLRDEILALPSPNELVATVEELTAKYRSSRHS